MDRSHLDQGPTLKEVIEVLTLGRQREYNLYISGAWQAKTRATRIEKYVYKVWTARISGTGDPWFPMLVVRGMRE